MWRLHTSIFAEGEFPESFSHVSPELHQHATVSEEQPGQMGT